MHRVDYIESLQALLSLSLVKYVGKRPINMYMYMTSFNAMLCITMTNANKTERDILLQAKDSFLEAFTNKLLGHAISDILVSQYLCAHTPLPTSSYSTVSCKTHARHQ